MPVTPNYGIPYQSLGESPNGASLGEDGFIAVDTELARIDAIVAGQPQVMVFTTSDTWSKPAGAKYIDVEVQGDGGAGGGAQTTNASQVSFGSGGSAGGHSFSRLDAASVTDSVTVTVGQGGVGVAGAGGGAGTGSSFGAYVTANGGTGGNIRNAFSTAALTGIASPAATAAGVGQVASTGAPGDGSTGWGSATNPFSRAGSGGDAALGGGGAGPVANNDGVAAGTYGGGGSGAANSISQAQRAGGNGGPGVVIVTTYFV